MEDGWEEGFTCGVKRQHTIHVDFSDGNTSIDNKNRSYQWAYLWRYDD